MDLRTIIQELENPSAPATTAECLSIQDIEKLAELKDINHISQGLKLLVGDMKKQAEKRELAENIVVQMMKTGSIDFLQAFSKVAELIDKNTDELKILSEAMRLSKSGTFSLGDLSDDFSPSDVYKNPTDALRHIIEKVKGE